VIQEAGDRSAKFTVIEGRKFVYSKIQQMVQETKNQLSIITTVPSLVRADQFGVMDTAFDHPLKSKIKFRFLTELSEQNTNAIKSLLNKSRAQTAHFEGRTPDLGQRLSNRVIIKDEDEAMFFIDTGKDSHVTEQEDTCLWTNSKTLVQAFTSLFEDMWRKSTDIKRKIAEIETGKPTPKTYILSDAETAKKKFHEILSSAKNEILMITSIESLSELWNVAPLKEWTRLGVSIKIMAPITVENLKAAQQLSKSCDVRHLPASYLRTTLVDGLHLFQFKTPIQREKNQKACNTLKTPFTPTTLST
jgi:sugar-specific transcriptional regulator TrmB